MKTKNTQRNLRLAALLGITLLGLTACASSANNGLDGQEPASTVTSTEAEAVTVSDAWLKTASAGEMVAAFGTLENDTDENVTVVSVTSPASPDAQLHEMVTDSTGQMKMQEVKGGFTIPAHDVFALEPGGNHIMLLDLPSAVNAGEDVPFTLTFSDGSTLEFSAVAKDYAGANESYDDHAGNDDEGDEGHDGMSGDDHS